MGTTAGAFLLQQAKPTALVGTLACLITGSRRGWISAGFFVSSEELSIASASNAYQFTMSRDVAIRFASVLQLLVIQSHEGVGALDPVLPSDDLALEVDRETVTLSTTKTAAGITYELVDDQLNVRIHPSVAERIAKNIWKGLAQYALVAHTIDGR